MSTVKSIANDNTSSNGGVKARKCPFCGSSDIIMNTDKYASSHRVLAEAYCSCGYCKSKGPTVISVCDGDTHLKEMEKLKDDARSLWCGLDTKKGG